mmetsp:Transcript_20396/g.47917  ORF Transcript_20396/g.47917 Transcript_20396/m.47917 type:complete len:696 (+) Transcript_20396:202-2289(+)|eukprot:CAMPEP_0197180422 /NCGR_PEP_ID=MMETSP1423-20130617/5045_1 /TAXON_ID=476441 /ORGANISM="Pseudo-nitzschia heimii, Strain UNC1101" /LENGTH=695 /DNA_ID=CAMNT_0042630499 /DNA_START=249 /DNA_END=2336 /DNA_ORIENTATION=-
MKGNQGLEALAALCGGRSKAVDMVGGNNASTIRSMETAFSTPIGASPYSTAPTPGPKPASPVSAAMKKTEILIPNPNSRVSVPAQHQQHSAPTTSAPGSTDSLVAPGSASFGNFTPQQISQAIAAAASSQGGRLDPTMTQSLLYPTAIRAAASGAEAVGAAKPVPAVPSANNILANTMQQFVIQQYLQQAQANVQAQQQQQAQVQAAAAAASTSGHSQAALLAMTLAAGNPSQQQQHFHPNAAPAPLSARTGSTTTTTTASTTGTPSDPQRANHAASGAQQQQAQQQAQAQALLQHVAQQQQQQQQLNTASFTSLTPAIPQQYHFPNGASTVSAPGPASALPSMMKIAAAGGRILPSTDLSSQNAAAIRPIKDGANVSSADDGAPGSKKQQKRAANRRSAQLSRKRKKQFIEELKEENDDLRRKEQILRAIPDLVVVFDSSGRLGFVSESVGRFLDISSDKLEGTSFWDLICEDSVRMIKAAFMDSLAAREANSDTAALGSGVWKLRLKNKNSKYMCVTLNGVVHFKGDAPECVCCIRPLGEEEQQIQQEENQQLQKQQQENPSLSLQKPKTDGRETENSTKSGTGVDKTKNTNRAVVCSDGDASRTSDESNGSHQSVLNSLQGRVSMSSAEQDEAATDAKKRNKKFRRHMASSDDGDNQSSSSNNNNNNNVEADGTNNSVRISDGDSNDGIESD